MRTCASLCLSCPSLLPQWLYLRPLRNSLPPLLFLQLSALEAYVWANRGVLADMAERLKGANASSLPMADKDGDRGSGGSNDGGETVARWALYALSLVAVRIAESVLSIVVWVDF